MRMPSAATATPPFSSVRKPSTSAVGQAERLARVRFLTRPCSRKLSRNRMAGGEPTLGTDSIYMGPFNSSPPLFLLAQSIPLHGYKSHPKIAPRLQKPLGSTASDVKTSV